MNQLQVDLPPEIEVEEARLLLSMKLFETGQLTLGQASNLAGHSKRAFMELLGKRSVEVFNYPPADLEAEIGC